MCLEANQEMSHRCMQNFIWQQLDANGYYVEKEAKLRNGRVADIVAISEHEIIIVEIKIICSNSLLESAFGKYSTECDFLIVASPPQAIYRHAVKSPLTWPDTAIMKIGLWEVDWLGITETRQPARLR